MSIRLRGRLVEVSSQTLLLDSGDECVRCFLPPSLSALCAADFVELTVSIPADAAQLPIVESVTVLATPKGTGQPFPSPGGDYFRINRDRRRQLLLKRSQALSSIRRYFAQHDFLEIEAPLLVPSPGLELHLQGFSVEDAQKAQPPRYLITSPEYQLKRLLVSGLRRIYSLGKVFRSGEAGPHHNPEFTMLEWYRGYEDWRAVAQDVASLSAQLATELHGSPRFVRSTVPSTEHPSGSQIIDLSLPWREQTVREAVLAHSGLDVRGDETPSELASKLQAGGYRVPQPTLIDDKGQPFWAWDDLFFSVFLDHVEPKLCAPDPDGVHRPLILCDWPSPLCALARRKPGSPHVVERFEAYIAGLELCNGFGELCDPDEQRQRFVHDLKERKRRGLPEYPIDERFLSALAEGMPPSGGVALGVDRLLMLLLDASHIRQVLPFGIDEL